MKRCVFCFLGLLAAISTAMVLENDAARQSVEIVSMSEPGQEMALKSEAVPEGWQPPGLSAQEIPDTTP